MSTGGMKLDPRDEEELKEFRILLSKIVLVLLIILFLLVDQNG
jgi:hypothetical protein